MAIIGDKITLDKTLVGNIARNQMESKMELMTKGALYVGTGDKNSVTPDGGGTAVPIPITSHIAPNGASDNGKVLVADASQEVGWKIDTGSFKTGTSAYRKTSNAVLALGQPFLETDTGNLFVGKTGTEQLKDLTLDDSCPSVSTMKNKWDELFKLDLEQLSWIKIHEIAQRGVAGLFFNIGDTKTITLKNFTTGTGTMTTKVAGTYQAQIIGINHRGIPGITFQLGVKNNEQVCWHDDFKMNSTATNQGGWKDSMMRITCANFASQSLPSDVQYVLVTNTIYTDNVGQSSNAEAAVTATKDKVFLLAEYEFFGERKYANPYEQNQQTTYAFYDNDHQHMGRQDASNIDGTFVAWASRSANAQTSSSFCSAYVTTIIDPAANVGHGFAPVFVV